MPYFDLFKEDQDPTLEPSMKQAFGGAPGAITRPGQSAPVYQQDPSGQAPAPVAAPSGVAGDSGSSFVNFERYLNSNRDEAGANAANVATNVTSAADKAAGGLSDLYRQFGNDVNAGTGYHLDAGTKIQPGDSNVGTTVTTNRAAGQGMDMLDQSSRPAPAPSTGDMNGGGKSVKPGEFGTGPAAKEGTSAVPDTNAPAPAQAAGTPAPKPANLTRDDLVKGSEQVYRGPLSLAQTPGFDAVTGQVTSAASQGDALQNRNGLSGLLAKNFGSAPVGSGSNELDTLLYGTLGGDKFADVGKKYGDLQGRLGRAVGDSEALANTAKQNTSDYAGQYKDLLGQFDESTSHDRDRLTAQQQEAQRQMDSAKRTADYFAPRHETTVRDIGNALDPTHWLGQAFGFRGINDRATDAAEQYGRDNMGMKNDSRQVHGLPPEVMNMFSKIFPNLTDEEVRQVEMMNNPREQTDWIANRYKAMGLG